MMPSLSILSLAASASVVLGGSHYLYAGLFSGQNIYGIRFDDADASLTLVNKINVPTNATTGAKWIALDERRKNLYVGTSGVFQSYAITDDLGLTYKGNISNSAECFNSNFLTSLKVEPYTVFATAFTKGCATQAISVDETGTLRSVLGRADYDGGANVHGTCLSPGSDFLYSADLQGNAVWVHAHDARTGALRPVQRLAAPEGADPRHLAVHPNGAWLYVVYETGNAVGAYRRDPATGLLARTDVTYSLLPPGANKTAYWADEVLLSISSGADSPRYLLASTRSKTDGVPGYVSALALDGATGAVTEQLFLVPTTGSGGAANAVAPAPFDQHFFANTDDELGIIEVWRISEHAGRGAAPVARLDTGGLRPSNVVWYS